MTRWCIECAQQQQHQAATKTVDGDPLCDFHAKKAGESGGETEPVTPAPAKKRRGPYRKRARYRLRKAMPTGFSGRPSSAFSSARTSSCFAPARSFQKHRPSQPTCSAAHQAARWWAR